MNAFTENFSWLQLGSGLFLAIGIALLAYGLHSLSRSGATAAALLGTVIFGLGGLPWAALLLTFFGSSSLLSHLFKRQKAGVEEKFSKGHTRDVQQVLANGGIAGVMVILQAFFPQSAWPWLAGAATLAAANADTWATELGVLSKIEPRLIHNGKKVEKGTSGGVSLTGILAALAGAFTVSAIAVIFWPTYAGGGSLAGLGARLIVISLAGLAGSLVDSLLGATLQAIYTCPTCHKETERHPLHSCGTLTTLAHGWPWLDNDWVNTACTGSAAFIGALSAILIPGVLMLKPANPIPSSTSASWSLSSPAFSQGAVIPGQYTCVGANQSPALQWTQPPAGTTSLALVVEDPDAPSGTFIHWVVYNLPADLRELQENISQQTTIQKTGLEVKNDFGHLGYDGPCPPEGKVHHYSFILYALDRSADLPAGLNRASLLHDIKGHILAQAVWMGTFSR